MPPLILYFQYYIMRKKKVKTPFSVFFNFFPKKKTIPKTDSEPSLKS